MNKTIALELSKFAEVIAERFSHKDRKENYNNEDFKVEEIIPMSDHTAVINFKKTTGKIGVAFCYYIAKGKYPGWKYFFPTDSHINGFHSFLYYKLEAERKNFKYN